VAGVFSDPLPLFFDVILSRRATRAVSLRLRSGQAPDLREAIHSAVAFQTNRFALIPESAGMNRRSVVNERVIR